DGTAERKAILAGHHDIQHHQIDGGGFHHLAGRSGVGRGGGAIAMLTQIARQGFADIAGILDQEDMGLGFVLDHGGNFGTMGSPTQTGLVAKPVIPGYCWHFRAFGPKANAKNGLRPPPLMAKPSPCPKAYPCYPEGIMRASLSVVFLLLAGTGSAFAAGTCPAPKPMHFEVDHKLYRNVLGFTEGLEFHDHALYESTGALGGGTRLMR